MQVILSPQAEALIRQIGDYGDTRAADELVEEALRPLEEDARFARFQSAVAEGFAELERGEVVRYAPELLARLRAEAAQPAREGRLADPDVRT